MEVAALNASAICVQNGEVYYSVGKNILHFDKDTCSGKYAYCLSSRKVGDDAGKASIRNFYVDGENITLYILGVFSGKKSTTKFEDILRENNYQAITGISLSSSEINLEVFATKSLTASVLPLGSNSDAEILWSSSDTTVATVTSNGVVNGTNVGTATITAEFLGFSASCVVTVTGDGLRGACGENVTWALDLDTGRMTISGTGKMSNYEVKNSNGTTTDKRPWSKFTQKVLKVTVAEGVTTIGDYAFYGFHKVAEITIPSSLTTIGKYSFYSCYLMDEIKLSERLIEIGEWAFAYCSSLVEVIQPSTVTNVGASAFLGCKALKSISLSSNLRNIQKNTFFACTSLKKVDLPDAIVGIDIDAFASCTSLEELHIGSKLQTINETPFSRCTKLTNVTVSSSNPYFMVSNSTLCSKDKSNLILFLDKESESSYSIANSTKKIYSYAFYKCNINGITIPNTVTTIGDYAFVDVDSKTLMIPNSVTSIGYQCFANDSTEMLEIEDGTQSITISHNAFQLKNLKELKIPSQVASGEDVFYGYNTYTALEKVAITKGTGTMYSGYEANSNLPAWAGAPVKEFVIEYGINNIPSYCFSRIPITSINLPNSITTIEDYAFWGSKIEEIMLPNSVTSIGQYAFSSTPLQSITISKNVSSIGDSAFYSTKMTEIKVDTSNAYFTSEDGVLFNNSKTELYAFPTKKAADEYTLPSTVQVVRKQAFGGCRDIGEIVFPTGLKEIGASAFVNCYGLTNIVIPDSVTDIGISAFDACTNVTSIRLPKSLTTIDDYGFRFLSNLKEFIISDSSENYTTIDGVLFSKDATELICYPPAKGRIYHVPNTVKTIKSYAFFGNTLSSLYLSEEITTIEAYAFCNCSKLKTIIIPESVTKMPLSAFDGCRNIESLIIPESAASGTTALFGYQHVYLGNNCKILFKDKDYVFTRFFWRIELNSDAVIYGHADSTAETYAKNEHNTFVNIDAAPHEHDYFLMNYIEKTEDTDGYELWECYCGEVSYEVFNHNYVETDDNATCTSAGQVGKVCSVCGDCQTVETTALGHLWEETTRTDGNCITPAIITFTCSRCGETKTEESAPETGHSYQTTKHNATCTAYGYSEDICEFCGESIVYDFTSPLGHKLGITKSSDNCSAHESYIYSCSRCDYCEEVVIDSAGLETRTVTTPATCTTAGSEKQVCIHCGATVSTIIIPATGHSFESDYTTDIPVSCTTEGSKSKHCTKCDIQILTEKIEAIGHDYGNWTVKIAATCTEAGTEIRMCKHDVTHTETRTIEATGHNFGLWIVKNPPTCIEEGIEERVCANDSSHRERRPIPKVNHQDNDGDGECDSCGTEIGTASTIGRCKFCGKIHNGGFIDRLIGFFHKIAYFFAHLFGKM